MSKYSITSNLYKYQNIYLSENEKNKKNYKVLKVLLSSERELDKNLQKYRINLKDFFLNKMKLFI